MSVPKFLRTALSGVSLIVLATLVAACGSVSGPIAAVSHQPTSTAPIPTATSGQIVAHVGDTLYTSDGMYCTLIKVVVLQPGEFDQPKPGDVYIVATVTLTNKGTSEADYNEFDFHLKTSSGNITDTTFASAYTANNELNSGTLAIGGTVTGDLIFEGPAHDRGAMLTWQPNFFGQKGESGWILGLS